MISIDEALAHYARHLRPLPVVQCSPAEALGRVLAHLPCAATDLPPFDQSAVDGYALHSRDLHAATPSQPVWLPVVGEVAAGVAHPPALAPGTAVRIFTGGPIPPGADTVARQEIVTREGDRIALQQALAPAADLRRRGEELAAGTALAAAGTRVTPGVVAALAMAGVDTVAVHRPPRLALLVTGDEVGRPGQALQPGQIYDANGPLLQAWCQSRDGSAPVVQFVPDTLSAVRAALEQALASADLVLTTGGVSVGDRDFIREAAAGLGVEEVFWRVRQKPGMPLYFGVRGDAAILGLPGNPGAVMVGLHLHAERALSWLEGSGDQRPRWRRGRLAAPTRGDAVRELLVRMRVHHDEDGVARLTPLGRQASHMLSNLTEANALVRVAAPSLAVDASVEWLPLSGDPAPI